MSAQNLPSLSPKELKVLRLISTGSRNKQIARDLFISVNTVEHHAKSIFRKLEVSSRTQAAFKAHSRGLL